MVAKKKNAAKPARQERSRFTTSKPAPRRTQEERRSEAEMRLLEAAREIVSRKGLVGMTLGEVGIAAGYSRGLATHHFGAKADLIRALAASIGSRFTTAFEDKLADRRGMHAVLEFISVYLGRRGSQWTNTRALLVLMADGITDGSETGQDLANYNSGAIAFVRRYIQEGIALKEIRGDIDAGAAATALLGTLRGIMLQKLLKTSDVDLAAVTHSVLTMTIYGLAIQPRRWMVLYPASK